MSSPRWFRNICYLLFVICYLLFVICYLLFDDVSVSPCLRVSVSPCLRVSVSPPLPLSPSPPLPLLSPSPSPFTSLHSAHHRENYHTQNDWGFQPKHYFGIDQTKTYYVLANTGAGFLAEVIGLTVGYNLPKSSEMQLGSPRLQKA